MNKQSLTTAQRNGAIFKLSLVGIAIVIFIVVAISHHTPAHHPTCDQCKVFNGQESVQRYQQNGGQ